MTIPGNGRCDCDEEGRFIFIQDCLPAQSHCTIREVGAQCVSHCIIRKTGPFLSATVVVVVGVTVVPGYDRPGGERSHAL